MHWRLKALQHKVIAWFPSDLSYAISYALPRYIGRLRELDPTSDLTGAVKLIDHILSSGGTVEGKTFLEVGTGRRLNIPLALWLCGAEKIHTVELNPYLKTELVMADIAFMRSHQEAVLAIFGEKSKIGIFQERWKKLLSWQDEAALLEMLNVHYRVGDAARLTDLADASIDYHISFAVLEHIPKPVMIAILKEGARLLKPGGMFVHLVDMSDHFSHIDPNISTVHFLQFEQGTWDFWADNPYHYHNRLRYPEYLDAISQAGLEIDRQLTMTDDKALTLLRDGFPVASQFRQYPPEVNAITTFQFVAKRATPTSSLGSATRETVSSKHGGTL